MYCIGLLAQAHGFGCLPFNSYTQVLDHQQALKVKYEWSKEDFIFVLFLLEWSIHLIIHYFLYAVRLNQVKLVRLCVHASRGGTTYSLISLNTIDKNTTPTTPQAINGSIPSQFTSKFFNFTKKLVWRLQTNKLRNEDWQFL